MSYSSKQYKWKMRIVFVYKKQQEKREKSLVVGCGDLFFHFFHLSINRNTLFLPFSAFPWFAYRGLQSPTSNPASTSSQRAAFAVIPAQTGVSSGPDWAFEWELPGTREIPSWSHRGDWKGWLERCERWLIDACRFETSYKSLYGKRFDIRSSNRINPAL